MQILDMRTKSGSCQVVAFICNLFLFDTLMQIYKVI